MVTKSGIKPIIAVAILFVAPWIYYFPAWLGPMAMSDNMVEMWHTASFAMNSLRQGVDPLWNPYLCSGFPSIAYTNTGMYSIFNLPHLILPGVFALAAEMALVHFIAGFGVYLFSRKNNVSVIGSLFGGIMFAFSGFFLTVPYFSYFQAGAGVTGFVLWALESARISKSAVAFVKWILIAAILIAVQFLAGHPQIALIGGMLYAAHVLWYSLRGQKDYRYMIGGIAAGIIGLAASAAVLLPASELMNYSYRETISWERFVGLSVNPLKMIPAILFLTRTELYEFTLWMGVPAIALAFVAARKDRTSSINFLLLCAFGSLLMCAGKYNPLYYVLFHMPVFSRLTAPVRYGMDFCFAISVLAAIGFDKIKQELSPLFERRIVNVFAAFMIVAIAGSAIITTQLILVPLLINLLVLGVGIWLIRSRRRGSVNKFFVPTIIVLAVVPPWLLFAGPAITGFDPRPARADHWANIEQLIAGNPQARVADFSILSDYPPQNVRALPAHNLNMYLKWSDAAGYQPLMLDRYGRLLAMDFTGGFGHPDKLFSKHNRAIDLLNVKAITIPAEYFAKPDSHLRIISDKKQGSGILFGENVDIILPAGAQATIPAPENLADIEGLAILSSMSYSAEIKQGATVGTIEITGETGDSKTLEIRAGIETAETIYHDRSEEQPKTTIGGIPFFKEIGLPLWKGLEHKFSFAERPVTGIAMTTYLYNAETVPQGEPVALVTFSGEDGTERSVTLVAGTDTAMWTAGNTGVNIAHSAARPAEEFVTNGVTGRYFLATKDIGAPMTVSSVTVKSLLKPENSGIYLGRFTLIEEDGKYSSVDASGVAHKKATVFNRTSEALIYFAKWDTGKITPRTIVVKNTLAADSKAKLGVIGVTFIKPGGASWPLHPVDIVLSDESRLKLLQRGEVAYVYENLQTLPRAWLAPDTLVLPPEKILDAIGTSRFEHGGVFDPKRTALIEKAPPSIVSMQYSPTPANDSVTFDEYSANRLKLSVGAIKRSMLVLSEIYYPGWETTVDRKPVETMQVDYVLRGVMIEPGTHVVEMNFRPKPVIVGRTISAIMLALSLVVVVGCSIIERKKRI